MNYFLCLIVMAFQVGSEIKSIDCSEFEQLIQFQYDNNHTLTFNSNNEAKKKVVPLINKGRSFLIRNNFSSSQHTVDLLSKDQVITYVKSFDFRPFSCDTTYSIGANVNSVDFIFDYTQEKVCFIFSSIYEPAVKKVQMYIYDENGNLKMTDFFYWFNGQFAEFHNQKTAEFSIISKGIFGGVAFRDKITYGTRIKFANYGGSFEDDCYVDKTVYFDTSGNVLKTGHDLYISEKVCYKKNTDNDGDGPKKSNIGPAIGGAVGGIVLVIVIVLGIKFLCCTGPSFKEVFKGVGNEIKDEVADKRAEVDEKIKKREEEEKKYNQPGKLYP